MAIDSATLKATYPVFADVDDALTDAKIAIAQANITGAAFGGDDSLIYEGAVLCYAAALLVDDPFGTPMGLTVDIQQQEENRYWKIYNERFLPLCIRRATVSGGISGG